MSFIVNCIMPVATSQETAGIGPFARFYIESTNCLLVLTRPATKQKKRVADVDDRGLFNILGYLNQGWTENQKKYTL